jgi:hypothetical protein
MKKLNGRFIFQYILVFTFSYNFNKELGAELQVLLSFCNDFSSHSYIIIIIIIILFYSGFMMNLF